VGRCAAAVHWSPKIRRLEPRSGRRAAATGESESAVKRTECNPWDQTPSAHHRPTVSAGMSDPSSNPTVKSPSACTGLQGRGAVDRWRREVGDRGVFLGVRLRSSEEVSDVRRTSTFVGLVGQVTSLAITTDVDVHRTGISRAGAATGEASSWRQHLRTTNGRRHD
jgi:hypothetical protein